MRSIRLFAVGTLSKPYLKEACLDYQKRIGRFYRLEIIEIKESRPPSERRADIVRAMEREGERLLQAMGKNPGPFVALAVEGKQVSSEAFADWMARAPEPMQFVIGGPFGLAEAVKRRADMLRSLSDMTLPHRLARLFLLEQLYRGASIQSNIAYHK